MDVSREEVEKPLKAIKAKKVPGPSGVSSELMKCAVRPGRQQLSRVFQKITDTKICSEE